MTEKIEHVFGERRLFWNGFEDNRVERWRYVVSDDEEEEDEEKEDEAKHGS